MQRRTARSAAIREIYRSGALATLARRAAGYRSDLDFAAFHKETIEEVFAGFDVDFLAVSAIKVDHRLQPLGGFDCVPLGLPESIVRSYQEVADADVVAPALYSNPGRIVSQATVLSEDAWLDHRFFRDHCRRYDIQRALMFGVLYPGHARKFITVEYLGSPNNGSFPGVDGGLLELATFPFTLAWLLRKGAMDDAMLERRFHALADLTGGELAALRKYVNSPYSDLAEQAEDSGGRRTAGYKNGLYALRDKLAGRFEWDRSRDGERSEEKRRRSLRPLDADYAFLRMLGDGTAPLVIP